MPLDMARRNFTFCSAVGVFIVFSTWLFCQVNSLVYRDFENVWGKERLSYGILGLGTELHLLKRTENENKFARFDSFYVSLYNAKRDKIAEFCNHYDLYLRERNVCLVIGNQGLEFLADCLENSSRTENIMNVLRRFTVIVYNPDSKIDLSLKRLTVMKIKFGVYQHSNDFLTEAQFLLEKYKKEDLTISAFVIGLDMKEDFYYDYNSFAKNLESAYQKLSLHTCGSKQRIIFDPYFLNEAYKSQTYKCLIFNFCQTWSEQKRLPLICSRRLCPHDHGLERMVFNTIEPFMFYFDQKIDDMEYLGMFVNPGICTDFNSVLIWVYPDTEMSYERMKYLAVVHSNFPCNISWNVLWDLDYFHSVFRQNFDHLSNITEKYSFLIKTIFLVVVKTNWSNEGKDSSTELNSMIKNHEIVLRSFKKLLTVISTSEYELGSSQIVLNSDVENFYSKHINVSTGLLLRINSNFPISNSALSTFVDRIAELDKTPILINFKYYWDSKKKDEFGGCYEYKRWYNCLKNWATLYAYNVIIESPSPPWSFKYSKAYYLKSWYKNPNLFGSGFNVTKATREELAFLSNLQDTCVSLPKGVPSGPVNFSSSYSGATFNLSSEKYSGLTQKELAGLLKLIHIKFSATELVLKRHDLLSTIIQAIQIVNSETNAVGETHRYFLNIGFQEPTTSYSFDVFSGVHFDFCGCKEDLITLRKLKQTSLQNVGISVSYNEALNLTNDVSWRELISDVNFTVIRVNLAEALFKGPHYESFNNDLNETFHYHYRIYSYDMQPNPFFDKIRAMRFNLRRINSNITVYIQLAWPTINHQKSREATQKLWEYLHDFSVQFDFPFFVWEAFDDSSNGVSDLKYGWWKSLDDDNIGDPNNYIDKQAEFYNLETRRPKVEVNKMNQMASNIPFVEIVIGMSVIFLLSLCAAIVVVHRLRQKVHMMLTKEELQQFKMGNLGSNCEKEQGNDYCTIAYDKAKYEISKCAFDFDPTNIIGSGFFGNVYKFTIPNYDKPVAVKVPKISGKLELLSVLREIKLMSFVGEHENILKLVGAYTKEVQRGIVYVITELADHGSLMDYLRKMERDDNIRGTVLMELYQFCLEISRGMHFLSQKKVIHGDLSTRNVLLNENNVCKICDFGLSRKLYYRDLYVKSTSEPVPWKWMAVEALERSELSLKSDIWSLGVTFWEIFRFGDEPYQGLSWDSEFAEKLRGGLRLPKPAIVDAQIYEKMLSCWEIDPDERPSAEYFIDFFQGMRNLSYTSL